MTTSVHEVMEAFRQERTNYDRGAKFEELMVRYFELDPIYSSTFDRVMRWSDWEGRNGQPDTGIDLVARHRGDGSWTAIQCKFYEPHHYVSKADIDSFLAASGKEGFSNRIIVSTTEHWGGNAEETIKKQTIPVQRIGLSEIAAAPIDWHVAWPAEDQLEVDLKPAAKHQPRPHQQEAIEKVTAGFTTQDRGKLIMACGTGKTFTSLKLVETMAAATREQGRTGAFRVLFLVPSISLMSQTLREWTGQTALPMASYAVCSDTKASRAAEDISTVDVVIPVTTDATKLAHAITGEVGEPEVSVVFSTYQSLPVIHDAQAQGAPGFDLIVCDEAHRTTGATLAGVDESNFVKIHDADYITGAKRLYMTATPRIFAEETKAKATENAAVLTSMDDETVYGPEFHRLGFGDAVGRGLLTDYKVLVLTVDEEYIAGPLQQQLADENHELTLDDATRIVGCWNGLAKRTGHNGAGGFGAGEKPMQRAVAFLRDIKTSKRLAGTFEEVIDAYEAAGDNILRCSVEHVDGTYNALERNHRLDWLKAPVPDGECRILSNARCLSEGVDVPALDAVMFLNPRNSVVDVIQSVGRVMRKAPEKDYGYIILPVAVPAGMAPEQALADNQRFKVVWQVLQALRAHDDRFNAMVNKLDLNKSQATDKLMIGHVGAGGGDDEYTDKTSTEREQEDALRRGVQGMLNLELEWRDAVYAKIVDKVGTRTYWEDWAKDVADIAAAQQTRIRALVDQADDAVAEQFAAFVKGLRENLNDSIDAESAISMLSQHLITKPVFDALFEGYDFAAHNPVSIVMDTMANALEGRGLDAEMEKLAGFYESVRMRAAGIENAEGKQRIIAELYEKFFKLGFRKQADALGIVYTPTEVVDFILRAADDVSRAEFGRGLTDEGVHILDPFTGTGTFITRLLQSGIINQHDLARKYAGELHANEIMLLAYYIAAVNIEATYHGMAGGNYQPFEGIVLTDTFQMSENNDTLDTEMFTANNDRAAAQLEAPIKVIVGNPPYSVGQSSANDNNANMGYPTLDEAIERTYAARSTATLKNSLYDSYIRAIRWATDRIGNSGVIAYVTNGGWIDGNTADGLRLTLAEEFSSLYIFNLRGNQRTAGEQSRKEGGKVFGSGSRNTVAILVAVKNPAHIGTCAIHYRDIGDYLTREEKFDIVNHSTLNTIEWQVIEPNEAGDWTNQRNSIFTSHTALGDRNPKKTGYPIFRFYSGGLKTNRDTWCYNYSHIAVESNMRSMIDVYNEQANLIANGSITAKEVDNDPSHISWSAGLSADLMRNRRFQFDATNVISGTYRPFSKQWVYFGEGLNERRGLLPTMFPTPYHQNCGFYVVGAGSAVPFSVLMLDDVPNLHVTGAGSGGQFFPRWTYEKAKGLYGQLEFDSSLGDIDKHGYRRIDNITDEILGEYQNGYGSEVTKDDIFYYIYGLLHSPDYRSAYASDLTKMLPRIPKVTTAADFNAFALAGKQLAELHLGYEAVEPYPLTEVVKGEAPTEAIELYRVRKMKYGPGNDKTKLVYNPWITLERLPAGAHDYMLGARSGIDWLIDRYQIKVDSKSGITNDPNDWGIEHGEPRYILELVKRVTTVSVRTVEVIRRLPKLEIAES
ncbi:DEAD/DEAH box helicase [Kocuria sp. M4R2S49]|uniref:DEAD/DEAH box helicase n=1 Tax=Kocuria rhizosphaericola TaxID=3376284 RepID=UPI0037BD8FB6